MSGPAPDCPRVESAAAAAAAAADDDDERTPGKESSSIERNDSKIGSQRTPPFVHRGSPRGTANGREDSTNHNQQAFGQNAALLHALDTAVAQPPPSVHRHIRHNSPASAGLPQLKTNIVDTQSGASRPREAPVIFETPVASDQTLQPGSYASPSSLPPIGSSLTSTLSASSMASSPGSMLASPYLAAMTDITPLPSPLTSTGSPWRKASLSRPKSPSRSRAGSLETPAPLILGRKASQKASPPSAQKKKKSFGSLLQGAVETSMANASVVEESSSKPSKKHSRNRSVSVFHPEQLHNTRPRNATLSSSDKPNGDSKDHPMQREANLSTQRGHGAPLLLDSSQQVPTPPPSTSSAAESEGFEDEQPYLADGSPANYLEIFDNVKNKRRKYREIRQLGEGTFSKVMLATSARIPSKPPADVEHTVPPHKLVAVKIVQHGPAGGADEARIGTGLKREVEMLKTVTHPSLIRLKACEYQPTRTLLCLTYCPGGDLFELASQRRELITPPLVRRIFAELVSAVRYLHSLWIVHRDLKLENVLVNLNPTALAAITSPTTHPYPLITLTDLGLSRRLPAPPAPPLLETRCGSEDYAAPEILLAQPYDGRQTDAWALGVLLYALLEGRLPFDAPPGKPERSRNTYRIARCDWIWCRFGDEEGDWKGPAEWEGARGVVEGLLKKVRMGRLGLEEVEGREWVREGMRVEGGLVAREEEA